MSVLPRGVPSWENLKGCCVAIAHCFPAINPTTFNRCYILECCETPRIAWRSSDGRQLVVNAPCRMILSFSKCLIFWSGMRAIEPVILTTQHALHHGLEEVIFGELKSLVVLKCSGCMQEELVQFIICQSGDRTSPWLFGHWYLG